MDSNNTKRISDYFYAESSASSGCSYAGLSYFGPECHSQCIQNGKRCPIYDSCMQRHNLRQILPY